MQSFSTRPFRSCLIAVGSVFVLFCSNLFAQASDGRPDKMLNLSDAAVLEEKIKIFNRDFCPPRTPISQVSDLSLLKLVTVQLIERSDIEKFRGMEMVDGRIVGSKAIGPETGKSAAGNNLAGELDAVCEEMKNRKTRGLSEGVNKPENPVKLKSRKMTYRGSDNKLYEMDVYSPPKIKAKKKKKVQGKKGKKIRDYASSRLLPKNAGENNDSGFKRKPSADSWLDNE